MDELAGVSGSRIETNLLPPAPQWAGGRGHDADASARKSGTHIGRKRFQQALNSKSRFYAIETGRETVHLAVDAARNPVMIRILSPRNRNGVYADPDFLPFSPTFFTFFLKNGLTIREKRIILKACSPYQTRLLTT